MNLAEVIQRDTRVNQPAANTVGIGTLYYVTDENVTERSNGTTWDSYSDAGAAGVTDFTDLGDVPSTYVGQALEVVRVNAAENALEFAPLTDTGITQLTGDVTAGAGSGSQTATVIPYIRKKLITLVIDGAGVVLTTGLKGYIRFPWTGTITKWTLLADIAGSIVIDIWKDTYANYPPVVGDTITAAAKPTLTAVIKDESSTLTGWTTTITAGDVLAFNVDSAGTLTRITLELEVTVTA